MIGIVVIRGMFIIITEQQQQMSRFIKPVLPTDNSYIQFKFQKSLRKYQPQPTKRLKCTHQICTQCLQHHRPKKPSSLSPSKYLPVSRPMLKQLNSLHSSIERHQHSSIQQKQHLVSSNKTIKLSKRKPLEERESDNGRESRLEMKIYQSLVNIRNGESNRSSQELEEEVYLNSFQESQGMEEEKDSDGDGEFSTININQKIEVEPVADDNVEQQVEVPVNVEQKVQNEQQEEMRKEQMAVDMLEGESIAMRIEKLSVEEDKEEQMNKQDIQGNKKGSQCNQNNMIQEVPPAVQHQQPQYNDEDSSSWVVQPFNPLKRARPVYISSSQQQQQSQQPSVLSSQVIEPSSLPCKALSKCLIFQGGRIYIDSQGHNFYISVRVFNKLRKKCQNDVDELINMLLQQRPYLEGRREQIRAEIEQYLSEE